MVATVMDSSSDLLQYRHLIARPEYQVVRTKAYAKELGQLAQGLPGIVNRTDTLDFIHKSDISWD